MRIARPNKNVEPSAPSNAHGIKTLTRRQRRALIALVKGPCFREKLDVVAGCSNFPHLAASLRDLGLGHHLQCERVPMLDRDGRRCLPGLYSLTPQGRVIALRWLSHV